MNCTFGWKIHVPHDIAHLTGSIHVPFLSVSGSSSQLPFYLGDDIGYLGYLGFNSAELILWWIFKILEVHLRLHWACWAKQPLWLLREDGGLLGQALRWTPHKCPAGQCCDTEFLKMGDPQVHGCSKMLQKMGFGVPPFGETPIDHVYTVYIYIYSIHMWYSLTIGFSHSTNGGRLQMPNTECIGNEGSKVCSCKACACVRQKMQHIPGCKVTCGKSPWVNHGKW